MTRPTEPTRRTHLVSRPKPAPAAGGRACATGGKGAADRDAFLREQVRGASRLAVTLRVQPADADDFLQDAALALVESKDPIESLPTWFRRTVVHRMLRYFRQEDQARSFEPRVSAHIEAQGSTFPAPDVEAEHKLALERLVKKVKPGRRAVAAWSLAGHGSSQIATALRLPKNTVKSQWERAKKELGPRAAVLKLLAVLWLWLVARGRRLAGALAGDLRPRAHTLFACAALPMIIMGHAASAAPPASEPEAAAHPWIADALGDTQYTFVPFLTTHAEREQEGPAGSGATHPGPPKHSARNTDDARSLLDQALTALRQGYPITAEDALRLYDTDHRDNPYPALRSQVVAGLTSSRSR